MYFSFVLPIILNHLESFFLASESSAMNHRLWYLEVSSWNNNVCIVFQYRPFQSSNSFITHWNRPGIQQQKKSIHLSDREKKLFLLHLLTNFLKSFINYERRPRLMLERGRWIYSNCKISTFSIQGLSSYTLLFKRLLT